MQNTRAKAEGGAYEHPKGSGIRINRKTNTRGAGTSFGESYRVRIPAKLTGEERKDKQFRTRHEAEAFAEDQFAALTRLGTAFADVPEEAKRQLGLAWLEIKKAGLTDLLSTVREGIKVLCPFGGSKTLGEVVEELVTSKRGRASKGGLDARTLRDFSERANTLSAVFGREQQVARITASDVVEGLKRLKEDRQLSPVSVRNYRRTLSEIFTHAKARGYSHENPFDRIASEDRKLLGESVTKGGKAPQILTPSQARRILSAVSEHAPTLLGSLVLRLFCGLRTEEVFHLDWKDVQWNDPRPFLTVSEEIAKKRRIREVQIPPNAVKWLAALRPPAEGKLVEGFAQPAVYSARFSKIALKAGFRTADGTRSTWPKNGTRHSFASYHFLLYGDATRTTVQLGHNDGGNMLFTHYRRLAKEADAEAYFSIVPPGEEQAVIPFPATAAR